MIKDIIVAWGKYSKDIKQKNRLIKARNTKRIKKHLEERPNSLTKPHDMETEIERDYMDFLDYLVETMK